MLPRSLSPYLIWQSTKKRLRQVQRKFQPSSRLMLRSNRKLVKKTFSRSSSEGREYQSGSRATLNRAEDLKKALSQLEAERDRRRKVMTNEQLRAEMKVLVYVEGVLKPAKVIGPTTLREGDKVTITGWVVHIEPSGLPHTTTADKIHPRT
jgi:hypothetical protein